MAQISEKILAANFEESEELYFRAMAVYPVRRDLAALKKRRDSGDPNVVAYADENGNIFKYQLKFTQEQREGLREAYLLAKNSEVTFEADQADLFVGVIEAFGDTILDLISAEPPDQKTRLRAVDSFINGVEKIDSALAEMDSSAIGWLYANVVDKLSSDGRAVSERQHPMRAQVEAGELRYELRKLAQGVVAASREAQASLPKCERNENDARLRTAKSLERQIIDHGMRFVTTETGFPAQCLRSMFELAGLETEKVSYWLKKVADDPDSYAKFLDRMRQKSSGENLPTD